MVALAAAAACSGKQSKPQKSASDERKWYTIAFRAKYEGDWIIEHVVGKVRVSDLLGGGSAPYGPAFVKVENSMWFRTDKRLERASIRGRAYLYGDETYVPTANIARAMEISESAIQTAKEMFSRQPNITAAPAEGSQWIALRYIQWTRSPVNTHEIYGWIGSDDLASLVAGSYEGRFVVLHSVMWREDGRFVALHEFQKEWSIADEQLVAVDDILRIIPLTDAVRTVAENLYAPQPSGR